MKTLNYLYGKPLSDGDYKSQPEDFRVEEILDIPFTGEGEHVCLQIIKREKTLHLSLKSLQNLLKFHREMSVMQELKTDTAYVRSGLVCRCQLKSR